MSPERFLEFHHRGLGKLLAIDFASASASRVVAQLRLRSEHMIGAERVQRGVVMTLADCANAYGAALGLPAGTTTETIESKSNFLTAGSGDMLTAESEPVHTGATVSVWRAVIFRGSGHKASDQKIAEVTQTQIAFADGTEPARAQDERAIDATVARADAAMSEAPRIGAARTELSRSFSQPVVDERWRQIFEGACSVIAEKGFAKATIREIAAAAEMPVPTMYQYLERKEDLLYRIYEYFMQDIAASLQQWRASVAPPRRRVEGAIRTIIDVFSRHHKYIKLMFQETRALAPEARAGVYALDARYIAVLTELLEEAVREDGFRVSNVELSANFVYFLCTIWPLRHWTIGKFGEEEVTQQIVDFVLGGLEGRSAARIAADAVDR